MHSIHVLAPSHQHQQQQQQQHQHQQELHDQTSSTAAIQQQQHLRHNDLTSNITTDQQQTTMTVLESLDPNQQLISDHQNESTNLNLLEDNNQSGRIIQQQSQPLLHQLQPSLHHNSNHSFDSSTANSQQQFTVTEAASDNLDHNHHHHQQHLHHHHSTESDRNNCSPTAATGNPAASGDHLRSQQRGNHQEAGIIAPLHDGGGPIVQWLRDKYEIAEGESLPRSTVYNHYLAYCRQLEMASVNAASFGKLIRSVFVGLKTRRLGTRGHSKYHYFGVRPKKHTRQEILQHGLLSTGNNENSDQNMTDNGSETTTDSIIVRNSNSATNTNHLTDDGGRLSTGAGGPVKRVRRGSSTSAAGSGTSQSIHQHQQQQQTHQVYDIHHHHHQQQQQQHSYNDNVIYYSNNTTSGNIGYELNNMSLNKDHHHQHPSSTSCSSSHDQHQLHHHQPEQQQDQYQMNSFEQQNQYDLENLRNHLGANWATLVDDHWPSQQITTTILVGGTQNSNNNNLNEFLCIFEEKYKFYYKRMVELLNELKFSEVEQLWRDFWQPSGSNNNNGTDKRQHHNWSIDSNELGPSTNAGPIESSQMNGQHQQLNNNNSDNILQHHQQSLHTDYESHNTVELNFHQLYELTSLRQVINRINQIDYRLYSAIESFLLPDLLSPIPYALAQQIRLFAKNIGIWIELSVKDYQPHFVNEKSKTARAFGYTLRRYTSLNHLATASRAIWDKQDSLTQLSIDLSRVDLRDIEHQVCLMSQSQNDNNNNISKLPPTINLMGSSSTNGIVQLTPAVSNANPTTTNDNSTNQQTLNDANNNNKYHALHQAENNHVNGNNNSSGNQQHTTTSHLCAMQPGQLIQNFLHLLEDPCPANSWPDWCKSLVESRVCGTSIEEARNFVLKWNFYISLIMKELTLRSAPSFGSFQLIRLLFDEYIFYLVITRLAQAQNKTPAQLLSS